MVNLLSSLSPYEYTHLTAHLVAAERVQDLHRLLNIETDLARNAWFELKDSRADLEAYFEDIRRVRGVLGSANQAGLDPRNIGLAVRYASLLSSAKSLANNFPPLIFPAAVRTMIWTIETAWKYAG